MRSCPVCRAELAQAVFSGVTVDGCNQCGGVWFDRDELTRMARGHLDQIAAIDRAFEATPAAVASGDPSGPCPTCNGALKRFHPPQTPGLSLVGCPAGHGLWLREGDFEAVIHSVEQWRARRDVTANRTLPPARERIREVARALLSRDCPRCQQPNATGSAVCWACGAVLTETETLFSCPRCFDPMDHLVHEGVSLNQCRVCSSLWLDRGELGSLIGLPPESLAALVGNGSASRQAPEGTPRSLPCPVCPGQLREHEYAVESGVRIHSCHLCKGLWIAPEALIPIQTFVGKNETFLPLVVEEDG